MSKYFRLEVNYAVGMSQDDKDKADAILSRGLASKVQAGLEAMSEDGRDQCIVVEDGFYFSAVTREAAAKVGLKPKPQTDVYMVILRADDDIAKKWIAKYGADPGTQKIEI